MAAAADDAAAKRFAVPSGKAAIYVARKRQGFGSAILFRCAIDGKTIGGIGPGTYRVVYVEPGAHTVTVFGNENEDAREISAEAGIAYFVIVHARSGMGSARVGLDPDAGNGRRHRGRADPGRDGLDAREVIRPGERMEMSGIWDAVEREHPTAPVHATIHPAGPLRVTVVDFDMPFVSMVGLMVKWAIAAIPAAIILIFFGAFVVFLLGLLGKSLLGS